MVKGWPAGLGPALFFLLGGLVVQTLWILHLSGGHFSYTLDDAYIHLALAENLAGGHYGVNHGEHSAAASSIVWPFLLLPLLGLPGAGGPLLLNGLAALGALLVWARLLHLGFADARLRGLALLLLVPATNLLGLVFTGMEHTLQVLLASLALWGLARRGAEGRAPLWLVPVLVAGPLVRYENLALSLPALGLLLARDKDRAAGLAGLAALGALLGGFSLYLRYGLGLDWLPTSVLAKSSLDVSPWAAVAENLRFNLRQRPGLALTGLLFVFAAAALSPQRRADDRGLALWGAAAVGLHLIFGRFGLYYRYEIYVWSAALLLLLYLGRGWLARLPLKNAAAGLALFCILFARDYARPLFSTPPAAAGIYAQQHQMHRFVAHYAPGPAAVNDLGRVAFQNPHYVLDLWGLSAPKALEARRAGGDAAWMDALAKAHGVELAMLYPQWFAALPPAWQKMGVLRLQRPAVTAAHAEVVFYSLDPQATPRLRQALRAFARDLPADARFDFIAP